VLKILEDLGAKSVIKFHDGPPNIFNPQKVGKHTFVSTPPAKILTAPVNDLTRKWRRRHRIDDGQELHAEHRANWGVV
jgi:hypothetical protein